MDEALRIMPDISADYIAQILPFRHPADLAYVIEGLRKAGLEE